MKKQMLDGFIIHFANRTHYIANQTIPLQQKEFYACTTFHKNSSNLGGKFRPHNFFQPPKPPLAFIGPKLLTLDTKYPNLTVFCPSFVCFQRSSSLFFSLGTWIARILAYISGGNKTPRRGRPPPSELTPINEVFNMKIVNARKKTRHQVRITNFRDLLVTKYTNSLTITKAPLLLDRC